MESEEQAASKPDFRAVHGVCACGENVFFQDEVTARQPENLHDRNISHFRSDGCLKISWQA